MSDYSAVAPPPQNFNQSSAFAAALQRAKQIAAKINPGSNPGDSRPKRPLEDGFDSEPDAKKGPGSIGPPSNQGPPPLGRPPQNPGMGGMNEDMKIPDKMVGLIIGRGGEQIQRLQTDTGCKIQLAPDSMGMPDRICTLSGSREAIDRAKEIISNIIRQRGAGEDGPPDMGGPPIGHFAGNMGGPGGGGGGGGGRNTLEIMIPGPKVGLIIGKGGETIKQLQEKSGAKMVVIQDGPNQEHEKPLMISGDPQKVEFAKQLVYDLIAEKEMKNFGRGGGGGRGGRNDGRGGMDGFNDFGGGGDSMEVLVPRPAVGVVIGKGGDMIKKIQAETGAKVQFQQARDEGPGDRRCYLSGNPKAVEMISAPKASYTRLLPIGALPKATDPLSSRIPDFHHGFFHYDLELARQRIDELIDSVLQRDGDGGGGGRGGGRGGHGGGRGRGGHHGGGDRFDRGNRNGGGGDFGGGGGQWEDRRGGGHGGGGHQDVVSFTVPAGKCGVIIGRGGETIKQINQQSGAYCELDRRQNTNPNAAEKIFTIKGDPDQIETAKRIVSDKVQLPLNFVQMSGGGGGGPQMSNNMPTAYPGMAPQGYNPQNNWGVPQGGYQQQQQQWGGQQQPNDGSQAPPGQVQMNPSTGQPDYSMQWAEYYRSLGMHREAEMIEQQAKSKTANPAAAAAMGGGAPQGAPPAAAVAAAAPTAAVAAQPDYSSQWAEYYRSIGKMKEAEAIEAQMKNKTPQTAATAAAPPGGTPAGYQQPQQAYGGYSAPASGYYGGQGQAAPVPGGVPQGGYGFPSYGYGQGGAGNGDN
ncbi:unnamed protein product [Phaedon cochleariae]|uniref:K Homology domain-containing protein n=1 Tax=Phaedon cochleariae TaxID=80249 RepID=A0A9P0DV80_PHACE|nr:unnamed protein product [Phaedon cochleariae]